MNLMHSQIQWIANAHKTIFDKLAQRHSIIWPISYLKKLYRPIQLTNNFSVQIWQGWWSAVRYLPSLISLFKNNKSAMPLDRTSLVLPIHRCKFIWYGEQGFSFLAFSLLVSGSYLDLHSVAHVDGNGVAAVHSGVKSRAGLRRCFDVTLWPSQIDLAGHCESKPMKAVWTNIHNNKAAYLVLDSSTSTMWASECACAHHVDAELSSNWTEQEVWSGPQEGMFTLDLKWTWLNVTVPHCFVFHVRFNFVISPILTMTFW